MTLESYLLFVGASIMLAIVPGPDMIFLLTRSVAQGPRAGALAALGINSGAYVHLTMAIAGLSALLATSALAFGIVKWAGACYLVYLGIRALSGGAGTVSIDPNGVSEPSGRRIFWQGFISDVLNPKVAIFFLAILPQFVDSHAADPTLQLIILGLTVNVIALGINLTLVWLAGRVTRAFRANESVGGWLRRCMGIMFIGLGARLLTEKR